MINESNKRKLFAKNQHQEQLIVSLFSPFIVLFGVIWSVPIVLILTEKPAMEILLQVSADQLTAFYFWSVGLVILLAAVFISSLVWVYAASNRWVGPFQRILNEMDAVIAGKGKRMITVRKDDMLANDLLKRINVLIDGYSPKDK